MGKQRANNKKEWLPLRATPPPPNFSLIASSFAPSFALVFPLLR